ncbi:Zinc finger protein-like 1 [Chamberlinius hualienensis]
MGLCKCPKKKVTNQFCFEHRVNVCEHCMVTNHPKCVVQSYIQWLQDSDFSPVCEICHHDLSLDECVRLVCYHVFHWSCLNHHSSSLPPNTAPAGYACPTCKAAIFPSSNLVSPIADKLMAKLLQVNWARAGIGLPLLEETLPVSSRSAPDGSNEESFTGVPERNDQSVSVTNALDSAPRVKDAGTPKKVASNASTSTAVNLNWSSQQSKAALTYPVSNVGYTPSLFSDVFSPKRCYDAREVNDGNLSFDHDDNKYRRRSATEWFSRWFKSMVPGSVIGGRRRLEGGSHRHLKRYVIMAILVVFALLTLIIIMNRYGRATADDDPFLDPMANPNIRVIDSNAKEN